MSQAEPKIAPMNNGEMMRNDIIELQEATAELATLLSKESKTTLEGFSSITKILDAHKEHFNDISDLIVAQNDMNDRVLDQMESVDDLLLDLSEELDSLYVKFLILAGLVLAESILIAAIFIFGGLS